MMLAIAIIAGIGYIFSLIHNIVKHEVPNVNWAIAAILVISTWNCLPLAIVVMSLTLLLWIITILIASK